ncbi:MAG: acetyltransferase [Lentisphaeria bacterium]
MKKLYIIGAGAFGRELESWLEQSPEFRQKWEIAGYLHCGESKLAQYPSNYGIVGDWKTFSFSSNDIVILAVADFSWKKQIYESLHSKVTFFTFIHPSVVIGKFNQIGEGTVICPNCIVTSDVQIGVGVTINIGTQIGHDVRIGDFCSLMAHVDLGGWVEIGNHVFMGTQSMVVPRKKIGDNCQITAGSVVMRNLKAGKTVYGNPAVEL